jgi:ferredoxin
MERLATGDMGTLLADCLSALQAGRDATGSQVFIRIDADNCIACGGCTSAAPRTFRLNEALIAELTGEHDGISALKAAVDSCPLFAITLHCADGTVIYPRD